MVDGGSQKARKYLTRTAPRIYRNALRRNQTAFAPWIYHTQHPGTAIVIVTRKPVAALKLVRCDGDR